MVRFAPLFAVVLVACAPLPEDPPSVAGFAACAAPSGAGWDSPYDAQHIDVVGFVTQGGTGNPPSGCELADPALIAGDPSIDDAWWIEVQDLSSADLWTLAFDIPGMGEPFSIGSAVHARWDWQAPEFGAGVGALDLRTQDETPIAWIGSGASLVDLNPPGITLETGKTVARRDDACGTVESYDLDVTAEGKHERVPYGETADVANEIAHHGGFDAAVDEGQCPDWTPDHAAAAIEFYYPSGNGGGQQ